MKIRLTPAEENWLEWALDEMRELVSNPESSIEMYGQVIDLAWMPKIEGNELVFDPNVTPDDVMIDLLYRLETQALAVSANDAVSEAQIANRARPAQNLADKIRKVKQYAQTETL